MYAMIEGNGSRNVIRWHRTKDAAIKDAVRWSLMYVYVHIKDTCTSEYCCQCKRR